MGQTISLSHIAPFVDVSRQKLYRRFRKEFDESKLSYTEEQLHDIVEKELMKEVESGCQTIQYQLITLQTTNGQAPFVTVFMYLNEVPEGRTRDDLATIIEVMLKQRMKGIKNEHGTYLPPAFPKLIYVLQENNITEGSKYWYLTELAAKCSTRALVPDYISEKKMLELKGDCYPCMGCVQKDEIVTYRHHGKIYTESIGRMWERMEEYYPAKTQPNGQDLLIDTPNVEIYDQKKGFVTNYRIIRNHTDIWHRITFTNGRVLTCTPDHPFETENRGVVLAKDLTEKDIILADKNVIPENPEEASSEMSEMHVKSVEIIHCDDYSYDVTTESEHFTVSGIYSHNCRSFLTPDRFTDKGLRNIANAKNWDPKKHKYYGRWNQGVVTISLPDVACSANGDETKFWEILNERLELCHRALRIRHERLLGTPSDVAPIQWQDGAVARLAPGETIDELLYHGYSTISLGYAGLAECVWRMKGCSHMSDEGMPFGLAVMQALNDACAKWKAEENIDYSVYGTPKSSRVA